MTMVQRLARFVFEARFQDLSPQAVSQLKIRLLDALGCSLGALSAPLMGQLRKMVLDWEVSNACGLIGGGRAAPDRAAFLNGALIRYLDFNDSYLAPGETCHPSDNIGAVLAAAETADLWGEDFLTALAVAYQVQCRLSDVAPVRHKGFDHTTQGAYGAAAGVAKALELSPGEIAHAVAISGTANNALRVTRTGALSHWKGLAAANTAAQATQAAWMARYGVTGPAAVFEGNKGLMDSIAGPFSLDWEAEDLEAVRRTVVKKYNAEIHSQTAIEAVLELRQSMDGGIPPEAIAGIEVTTFETAYHIIGGGAEGEKQTIHTKEEADHSLPYLVAVALLDGEVLPAQFEPARILQEDVQALLRRVEVHPNPDFSRRFPQEMPCRVVLRLTDGTTLESTRQDYQGFTTRPPTWESATQKFCALASPVVDAETQGAILNAVAQLEQTPIRQLVRLLENLQTPVTGGRSATK